MKKILILLFLSVLLLSGCARYYIIGIDSINNREPLSDKSFVLLPGNKDTSATELQFQEYAGYVAKILASTGYALAASQETAAIEIFLSYGVGEPESHVYSYAEPVWGQVRANIKTYTTQSTTTSPSGDTTTYASNTRVDPEYGITGFTTKTGVYTSYNKFIVMDAYDLKTKQKDGKLKHLWKTTISSAGTTKDLRKLFPVMLIAAKQHIGGNTGEELEVQYPEESEEVKLLKTFNQ